MNFSESESGANTADRPKRGPICQCWIGVAWCSENFIFSGPAGSLTNGRNQSFVVFRGTARDDDQSVSDFCAAMRHSNNRVRNLAV